MSVEHNELTPAEAVGLEEMVSREGLPQQEFQVEVVPEEEVDENKTNPANAPQRT